MSLILIKPLKVVISGGAGNIAYALSFMIAQGGLDSERKVILTLLETEAALPKLDGVEMELADGNFPLISSIEKTADQAVAFNNADVIFLVGAAPRKAGMERSDLLLINAEIFKAQGQAINSAGVNKHCKILVVGNPANTNCLIAMKNAPSVATENFSAMTRLDHNRFVAQIAEYAQVTREKIKFAAIFGNHSSMLYPHLGEVLIDGKKATEVINQDIYQSKIIPTVRNRGAQIIDARGASSAASAAAAALQHMKIWRDGSGDDITSMGLLASGHYEVPDDLVYSYPVTCKEGEGGWNIVGDMNLDNFAALKIKENIDELLDERDAIRSMLP